MAKINSTIPEFSTQAFVPGQDDFVTVTSDDVKGQWSIFLFYPADFTFVCPTELEDMQNIYAELQQLGVQVYSVSTDSHFVHKAWHETSDAISKVTYPMLGDSTGAITRGFDIMIEEAGQGVPDDNCRSAADSQASSGSNQCLGELLWQALTVAAGTGTSWSTTTTWFRCVQKESRCWRGDGHDSADHC